MMRTRINPLYKNRDSEKYINIMNESEFNSRLYHSVYEGLTDAHNRLNSELVQDKETLFEFYNAIDQINKNSLFEAHQLYESSLNEVSTNPGTNPAGWLLRGGPLGALLKPMFNVLKGITVGSAGLMGYLLYKALHGRDSAKVLKTINNAVSQGVFGKRKDPINTRDGQDAAEKVHQGSVYDAIIAEAASHDLSKKQLKNIQGSYVEIMRSAIADMRMSVLRVHKAMFGPEHYELIDPILLPADFESDRDSNNGGIISYTQLENKESCACTFKDELTSVLTADHVQKLKVHPNVFITVLKAAQANSSNKYIERYGQILLGINGNDVVPKNANIKTIDISSLDPSELGQTNCYIPNSPLANLEVFVKVYVDFLRYYTDSDAADALEQMIFKRNDDDSKNMSNAGLTAALYGSESYHSVPAEKMLFEYAQILEASDSNKKDTKKKDIKSVSALADEIIDLSKDSDIKYELTKNTDLRAQMLIYILRNLTEEIVKKAETPYKAAEELYGLILIFGIPDKNKNLLPSGGYESYRSSDPGIVTVNSPSIKKAISDFKEFSKNKAVSDSDIENYFNFVRDLKKTFYENPVKYPKVEEFFVKTADYIKDVANKEAGAKIISDFENNRDFINVINSLDDHIDDSSSKNIDPTRTEGDRIQMPSDTEKERYSDTGLKSILTRDTVQGNNIEATQFSTKLKNKFDLIKFANSKSIEAAIQGFENTKGPTLLNSIKVAGRKGEMSDASSNSKTFKTAAKLRSIWAAKQTLFDDAARHYIQTFYSSEIYTAASSYLNMYIRPYLRIMLSLPDEDKREQIEKYTLEQITIKDVAQLYPIPVGLLNPGRVSDDEIDTDDQWSETEEINDPDWRDAELNNGQKPTIFDKFKNMFNKK